MGKQLSVLLIAAVVGVLMFFVHTEAGATFPTNLNCPPGAGFNCGDFEAAGVIIEFKGTSPDTCALGPCTKYNYQLTGTPNNQVSILIPKEVMTKVTSAADALCVALITNGTGDPLNFFFGINNVTHNVCRLAANIQSGVIFSIRADANSTFAPLSWQDRFFLSPVRAAAINGPGKAAAPVTETGATLARADGADCTYKIVGGVPDVTSCPGGAAIPLTETKLCVPAAPGVPITFGDCKKVLYATEGCDIKTSDQDPCRYVGGYCIRY
jgi:hypothetical protein